MRVAWIALKLAAFTAALVAAAVWLADQPGELNFGWRDATVQMPSSLAAILVLALCMILWKVGKLFFWLKYGAARRAERRQRLRDRQGLDYLTASLNALAARDLPAAARAQQRAEKLLGHVPLATWLGGQIAQRQEHGAAARQSFLALTNTPSAANLGWRGLMGLKRDGAALSAPLLATALANKATARQPYLHEARLSDAVRLALTTGEWGQARDALHDAESNRALPKSRLRQLEQAVLLQRGLVATDAAQARLLLEQAYKRDPSFAPAALALLDRLLVADRTLAAKLFNAVWLTLDDDRAGERLAAALLQRWVKLYPDDTALGRLQRFDKLAKKRPQALVTQLALARLNLDAEQWEAARTALGRAQDILPTPTGYRGMAELALAGPTEADRAGIAAPYYMERAHDAGPAWACAACGNAYPDWQMVCDSCGMVATIVPAAETPVAAKALI